jgi:hypothetical protein
MRTLIVVLALLFAAPASFAQPGDASSGRRVALVVGVNAYRNFNPLDNPDNDARLMAQTLAGLGFTVVGGGPVLDPDKRRFDAALQDFARAARGAEAAFFYYSGHGAQIDGHNWLAPVDATLDDPQMRTGVDTEVVLDLLRSAHAELSFIVLDACRNNPLVNAGPGRMHVAAPGLAEIHAPDRTVIAYATQPGNTASQGPTGGNSPYVVALVAALRTPGLDVFRVFNQAGNATVRATNGEQRPWLQASAIDADFTFAARGTQVAAAAQPANPQAATPNPSAPQAPAAPATPAPAAAQDDPSFALVNLSGQAIVDLRASLTTDRDWGRNRLNDSQLRQGARVGVQLPTGGSCGVDLRLTFADGSTVEGRALETCRIYTLVVGTDRQVHLANPNVVVVNQSGRIARDLRVSLSSDPSWGDNWLSGGLEPGGRVAITLPQGIACSIDLHAEFAEGQPIERRRIDTCAVSELVLQ